MFNPSMWTKFCLLMSFFTFLFAPPVFSETVWSLDATTARMIQLSPELRVSQANLSARKSALKQAGTWQNPTLELEANNNMGLENGSDDYDLSRVAVTQPLEFSRVSKRKAVAEAELKREEIIQSYRALLVKRKSLEIFLELQSAKQELKLADERLQFIDRLLNPNASDPLVRYLNTSNKIRLQILREEVYQGYLEAKSAQDVAENAFRLALDLPEVENLEILPIENFPTLPADFISMNQDQHPLLLAAKQDQQAALARVNLSEAERRNAPELTLYQERDIFNGQRETVFGVGVSMQIPVWGNNSGSVSIAKADAEKADAEYIATRRQLNAEQIESRVRLQKLMSSGSQFKSRLLEPTEKMLQISRRSFSAGDADVLTLIDAFNGYFEARLRYLDLIHDTWLAAADYSVASGVSLIHEENLP